MKSFRAIAGLLVLCSAFLVGCSEKSKVTDKKTVSDPGGSTTQTTTTTTEKTGEHKANP